MPPGRDGTTPKVSLNYSVNNRNFDSVAGYGWNVTQNAIYRSTNHGVDKLYDRNDFTAELNGQATELVLIDSANQIYGAKTESSFTKYQFTNNTWIATDTKGMKYYFGQTLDNQQTDPDDSTKIYKWMLEKVEDMNGNYITYTYMKDGGQIYPQSIRYTGHGADLGIGEVKFLLTDRPEYTEYRRGFKVTTRYIINSIETYTYHDGGVKRVLEYDFGHEIRNNAVQHLNSITMKSPDGYYPPTAFQYFDGTEATTDKKINLIKKIVHPYGAVQTFTYKPDTAYRPNGNLSNKIPFVVYTLRTDTIKADVDSPEQVTTYEYNGGHYFFDYADAYKKEYAGFHKVTVTDPEGNIAKHFYHQSDNSEDGSVQGEFADHISKKGREYRTEVYDNAGNLYELGINKWEYKTLPNQDPNRDRYFLFNSRQVSASYDGNSDYIATASETDYDDWGNVKASRDFGEVTLNNQAGDFTDVGNDRINQNLLYAQNASKYLYGFASESATTDQTGTVIAKSTNYYDNLPLNEVSFGNVTRTDQLATKEGEILTTLIEYDEFGLPKKYTNPRGFETHVTYDSHNFFPHSITNHLGQTSWMTYDMRFGIQNSFTDPNGAATATTYDDFGRAIETRISDPATPTQEVTTKTIVYDLNASPANITTTTFTGQAGIEITSKTYLDGLGRTKQTRVEAENGNYIVANQLYDKRGNVKKQFLPTFKTGLEFTLIDENELGTVMGYDALGRVTKTITPIGTATKSYDQNTETIFDGNQNRKDLEKDIRGNLIKVTEYLESVPYNTNYTYNTANQLVKITDALGNERNMTYDLLGRKLSDEDLHVVGDTTFGSRSYLYDNNGNLKTFTDAKGNTVEYDYDEIDRLKTEDFLGETGIETTYVYDQGNYGLGRLSSTTTKDLQKSFTYDVHGKVLGQKYMLDGTSFDFGFTYDWNGSPLSMTYPDGKIVSYQYNAAGTVNSVKNGENFVVNNVDYSPTGAITKLEFANGTTTTQSFPIEEMYRMTNKITSAGAVKLQDLSYVYDPVGNLKNITDVSSTALARISEYEYDDLYRLTKATVTSTTADSYVRDYGYNIIGNMISRSDLAGTYVYDGQVNAENVYSTPQAVTSAGGRNFAYDKNGNITSDGMFGFNWDYKNRLNSSTGTENIKYTYDEGNIRVKKDNLTNGDTTYYINKFYDLEGGVGKSHIFLGDLKLATVKTGEGANNKNDYKFTGKELDDETGLYYYGARYYDADLSRFVSRDTWAGIPTNPQTLNKYSYVKNNPLKYVDPSGNVLEISGAYGKNFVKSVTSSLEKINPNVKVTQYGNNYRVSMNIGTWDRIKASIFGDSTVKLLNRVIDSDHTITIQEATNTRKGRDLGAKPANKVAASRIGCGGTIGWTAGLNPTVNTYQKDGTTGDLTSPAEITLAHELIHTTHYIDGSWSGSKENVNYKGLDGQRYNDTNKEEVRTMGLGFNKWFSGDITENDIREDVMKRQKKTRGESSMNKRNKY